MRLMTPNAKLYGPMLEDLARARGIDTKGVDLYISTRVKYPEMIGGSVRLPMLQIPQMIHSFLHELQHARDLLDGVDLHPEEMERRARAAEYLDLNTEMDIVNKHFPGYADEIPKYRKEIYMLRTQLRGKGWHREPYRHALAAHGIRTRAIHNPVADPSLRNSSLYGSDKGRRKYRGSGLENVDKKKVIDFVRRRMGRIDEVVYSKKMFNNWFEEEKGEIQTFESAVIGDMTYRTASAERLYKALRSDPKLITINGIYIIGSRVTGFWKPDSDIDLYVTVKPTKKLLDITRGSRKELEYLLEILRDQARVTSEYNYYDVTIDDTLTDMVRLSLKKPTEPALLVWEAKR